MRKYKHRAGVTLMELVVSICIMGILFMGARVMIQMTNTLAKQRESLAMQREAQVALYLITQDIRNSRMIVEISSWTSVLDLRVFDPSGGFDVDANPNLFNMVNVGTVTWRFVNSGGTSYLERTSDVFSRGISKKKFCKNILAPPDLTSEAALSTTAIFDPTSEGYPLDQNISTFPYMGCQILLQARTKYMGDMRIKKYSEYVSRRGMTQ